MLNPDPIRMPSTLRWTTLLLLAGLLGACASPAPPTVGRDAPPSVSVMDKELHPDRKRVVSAALSQLGTPYRYGGDSPRGFDCSGLVQYAHQSAHIQVPRQTGSQAAAARQVSRHDLRPGDLLFFRINDDKPSHVSIYLGDGRFVHAPSSGGHVSIESLDNPYWAPRLLHTGHYFPD